MCVEACRGRKQSLSHELGKKSVLLVVTWPAGESGETCCIFCMALAKQSIPLGQGSRSMGTCRVPALKYGCLRVFRLACTRRRSCVCLGMCTLHGSGHSWWHIWPHGGQVAAAGGGGRCPPPIPEVALRDATSSTVTAIRKGTKKQIPVVCPGRGDSLGAARSRHHRFLLK